MEPAPEKKPRVPPGFHFIPTGKELIDSYLNPWIAGEPLGERARVVCLADVYGCDPATLTRRFKDYGFDGHWYFLCVARWKGGNRAAGRVNRCVGGGGGGGGTWHNSYRRKCGGCLRLGFEHRDAANKKTGWLMEEFASNLEEAADDAGVKVLCKVYLSPRAPPPPEDEEERRETKPVGSKRPTPHGVGMSSAAPPSLAADEEERQETKVTASKRQRPALPAPAEFWCSNTAGVSQTASMPAWMQSVYYGDYKSGVALEQAYQPLAIATANGEVEPFATTDGLDMAPEEAAAANLWLDDVLNFYDGGAGDGDEPTTALIT